MAREKEDFRVNLEQLNRLYPDREMLTIAEIMGILGYKSPNSVRKNIPLINGRASKAAIARYMCG